MDIKTIWSEFLTIVKEEVGSRVVETWFKSIVFHGWDAHSKSVYLKAPNTFVRDWVLNNYQSLLLVHLGRLLHEHNIHIQFVDQPTIPVAIPVIETPAQPIEQSASEELAVIPAVRSLEKAHAKRPRVSMNPQYMFNTFIVGPHNSLAYAAAHAITEKPGTLYNPFFIYGGSGLGKTHLLHAIGNEIKERYKNYQVLYQGADRFVHEFINAIRFDKMYQFEARYRGVDVLLIDDIQFISNKEQTQEAFFHIFNMLYQAQKQIVFTSDSLPGDIAGLADRMRSRLESGLVTDVSTPTLETKIAIIKKKSELYNEQLHDDIAHFIASCVTSNVRDLEGALIRVFAVASLTKQSITLELAQKVLAKNKDTKQVLVDMQTIAFKVAKHFDYSLQEMRLPKRNKDLTFARHVAVYLMKKLTKNSLREIGNFLKRKDHSTVIHALEKVETLKKRDVQFAQLLERLENDIMQ